MDNNGYISTSQVTINVGNGTGTNVSIIGIPSPPLVTDGLPIALSGSPAGGTFSGEGVAFSFFNPALLPPGLYTVTYTLDDGSGCASSVSEEILVAELFYNFVTYNLGTIEPKIIIDAEVFEEGTRPVSLFDAQGKILYQDMLHMAKGKQQFNIILNNPLKGIYFLQIGDSPVEKIYAF